MSSPTLSWSRLAGILIAIMPLVTLADTEQTTCPTLLMESECRDYQAALNQAQSAEEVAVFADKYAALLEERLRLCPNATLLEVAGELNGSLRMKWARHFLSQ